MTDMDAAERARALVSEVDQLLVQGFYHEAEFVAERQLRQAEAAAHKKGKQAGLEEAKQAVIERCKSPFTGVALVETIDALKDKP